MEIILIKIFYDNINVNELFGNNFFKNVIIIFPDSFIFKFNKIFKK
jgi:hypothetical protein